MVDNQIRGKDVNIVLGIPENIHIEVLRNQLLIQRRIGEWLHIALGPYRLPRQIGRNIGLLLTAGIPNREEHEGQIGNPIPFQAQTSILPMAQFAVHVDVFIRDVDAPVVGHIAIND